MKHLYCRLAVTNLKNNRQLYLPYILAGMVSVMMFYIMLAIQGNEGIADMRGSDMLRIMLSMGSVIAGICSCIFLFYTNSFVMKRRKRELGIYNILGMEKKHIAKVMAWETALLYVLSIGGGLIVGIVFNKLVAMFLYKLTGLSETIPFYISGRGCLHAAIFFAGIYMAMLVYNFIQVRLARPTELLKGSHVGEREPKAKWISAILGIVCIVIGYYLAITVYGVIEAVNMFFVAVLLVIVGTYELFMAVSIAFLKILKGNKNYYYKTNHFIAVSGMLYRMKRNAVGLASICILSTMVLVMISTTVCMYAGTEDTLQYQFEKEIGATVYFNSVPAKEEREYLSKQLERVAKEQGRTVSEMVEYVEAVFTVHLEGNAVEIYNNEDTGYDYTGMSMLYAMTEEEYKNYIGQELPDIMPGNAVIASITALEEDTINIFGEEYTIQEEIDFPDKERMGDFVGTINMLYAIVSDEGELDRILEASKGQSASPERAQYHIEMEIDGSSEERKECAVAVSGMLKTCKDELGIDIGLVTSRTVQREEYMKMNGGFLFLGLFLGIMFLMITMLIIYYKQVSEGFEDRERFAIMTKVGMNQDMVREAISTQVRIVFFMPISVAVIHLIAAFPMLKLILLIFGFANIPLFAGCLAATVAAFAIIYFMVFQFTSKSYYQIVYQ